MSIPRGVRALATRFHRGIASSRAASRAYLEVIGRAARLLPDGLSKARLMNGIGQVSWPAMRFAPRGVDLPGDVTVRLVPHLGEFDARALFSRALDFEDETLAAMLPLVKASDVVIDIGANIGLYAMWCAKVARPGTKIFAFEPAPEALRRLRENMAANAIDDVTAFGCAIGERTAFVSFFEPAAHLTNGSLDASFAGAFSDDVRETRVLAIDGAALLELVRPGDRVLVKIDVEGCADRVLRGLRNFIEARRPAIAMEVLQVDEAGVRSAAIPWQDYRCFRLEGHGPVAEQTIEASERWRDHLLLPDGWPSGPAATASGAARSSVGRGQPVAASM